MTNKEIVIFFEKHIIQKIIHILSNLQANDLVNLIKRNSQAIVNSTDIVLNENFPFQIHLDILNNYVNGYKRHYSNVDDLKFLRIVYNDFCLYWQNIKSPQLMC